MELLPGTALHEKSLTDHFGVSRTPVREAMLQLARDGLVDMFPQSGSFVSRIPIADIREAALIRNALESITVARAAVVVNAPAIAQINNIIAQQQLCADAMDTAGFHEMDEAFHEYIANVAGYPKMWRVVRQTKVQIDRVRHLTLPVKGRMGMVISEHQKIRDAIAAFDVDAARQALMDHLSAIVPDIGRLSNEYPDYFEGSLTELAPRFHGDRERPIMAFSHR